MTQQQTEDQDAIPDDKRVMITGGRFAGEKGYLHRVAKGISWVILDCKGDTRPFRSEEVRPFTSSKMAATVAPASTTPAVRKPRAKGPSNPVAPGEIVQYPGFKATDPSWEVVDRRVYPEKGDDRERIKIKKVDSMEFKILLPTNVKTADGRWGK